MELLDFQKEAVKNLLETAIDPNNKMIIFKSPTGSGKTVMMIDFIGEYIDTIDKNVAFIWLCPGKGDLEEQSRQQMLEFARDREIFTIHDALSSGFAAGSTTFINWEMVTKEGNKAITDNEQKSLFERIYEAKRDGISFIIIVDEEHSNNTSKAKDIINAFNPRNEIRVSATAHKVSTAAYVEIDETSVIDEGIIAKAIYVNEDIKEGVVVDDEVSYLINKGDEIRKKCIEEYKKLNVNINPLVVIQLANGKNAKIEPAENALKKLGYTYENGVVGKWLSDDKINIDNLKKYDSKVSFLIMKQAIATGWDCPRAKILIKLRDTGNEDFEIQTIGRIRRMPERKHYNNDILDNCYVFTFDEKYKAGLFGEVDRAYSVVRIFRKKDKELDNFKLMKGKRVDDEDSLGIKEVCLKLIEKLKNDLKLNDNYEDNKVKFEANGYIVGNEIKTETISGRFIKVTDTETPSENQKIKLSVIANTHIHGIDMQHSLFEIHNVAHVSYDDTRAILENLFYEDGIKKYRLLNLSLTEFYAFVINNEKLLKETFRELNAGVGIQQKINIDNLTEWRIPKEEVVKYDPIGKCTDTFSKNVYDNYNGQMVTDTGKIRSQCEIMFEKYIESANTVKYIYKNGDKGEEYFCVPYDNYMGRQFLFYPDYLLMMTDGTYMIVETKGGERNGKSLNIDMQVENKFNAFKEYAKRMNMKWGFVRYKDGNLYFNNTTYVEEMSDKNWEPIENLINGSL